MNGLNLNFSTVANNVVDAGTPSGRDLNGGNQQLTLKGRSLPMNLAVLAR